MTIVELGALIKAYSEIIVAGGIVLGLSIAIFKKGKGVWTFFADLLKFPARIKNIESELTLNGGSSMKDAIARIEEKQLILHQKFIFAIENGNEPLGMAFADTDGLCTFASPHLCGMYGCSEYDLLGNNWVNLIKKEDRDRIMREWKSCLADSRPFDQEYAITTGEQFRAIGTPVRNLKNKVISWFFIVKLKEN